MKKVLILTVLVVLAMGATAMAAGFQRGGMLEELGIDPAVLDDQRVGEYLKDAYTEADWGAFRALMMERKLVRLAQVFEKGMISQETYDHLSAQLEGKLAECTGEEDGVKLDISQFMNSKTFGFRRGGLQRHLAWKH